MRQRCHWQPGLAREGHGDGIAGVDAVLGRGAEVGSDAAELNGARLGSESAGDLLLDLHGPDIALGLIVGPGDMLVIEESQGFNFAVAQSIEIEIRTEIRTGPR